MSGLSQQDSDNFRQAAESLERLCAMMERPQPQANSATIHINAGGFGVWLSATLAAVMCVVTVICVIGNVERDRRIDDLNHYLNAVYQQAPHLRPKGKDPE